MKFNRNLAAIHGYLCGDGYVIKNPDHQQHKYYCIGFRNTNDVLLRDFQNRFRAIFDVEPHIAREGRCRIQRKEIYKFLTKGYSYYSHTWKLPNLSNKNLKHWLRAFFDCEGWVENQPGKSRLIGLDCCNKVGLESVQNALKRFGIASQIHRKADREIWRLAICGLNDLRRFYRQIGFLHPDKDRKLGEALDSYKDYSWSIPQNKAELSNFIKEKGKIRASRDEIRFYSIVRRNLINLKKGLNKHRLKAKLFGPWTNNSGSDYYCLIIKEMEVRNGTKKRTAAGNEADYRSYLGNPDKL